MNDIYIDQSSKELRLNLIYSELNKFDLNVISSESITYDDIYIEVGIIGASHYLTIKYEKNQFSEVFACLELNNSNQACTIKKPEELLVPVKENITSHLKYEFSSEILNWNKSSSQRYNVFSQNTNLCANSKNSVGLSHIFPHKKNDTYLAKTEVFVKKCTHQILVETLHAYPNEDKIVFTKTTIEKL